MSFIVLSGDGVGSRPQQHLQNLIRTTGYIERLAVAGRVIAGRCRRRRLTAIERGVVATRMLRDGFCAEQVMSILERA